RYDNFAVDPPAPAKLAYLQQPSAGTAGAPLGPFVVAVEDSAGHTVSTDASTVTLTLSHGTFANGAAFVTAPAVNGVARFSNLVINTAGTYTLSAGDGSLTGATSSAFTISARTATQVNLAGAFNQVGIVRDGSTFSGGLDGGGSALSGTLLGTSRTWNGTAFTIGAVGGNNVVSATGQTINLPAG